MLPITNANRVVVIGLLGLVKENMELADYVGRVGGGDLVREETKMSGDNDRALLCFKDLKDAASFKSRRHKFKDRPITVVDWYSDWFKYKPDTFQVEIDAALQLRMRSNTGKTIDCQSKIASSSQKKKEVKCIDGDNGSPNPKMNGGVKGFPLGYGNKNDKNASVGVIQQTNVQTGKARGSIYERKPEHKTASPRPLNPKSGGYASKGHDPSSQEKTKRNSMQVNLPPENQQYMSGSDSKCYRGEQPTEVKKKTEFGNKPKFLAPLTFHCKQGQKIQVRRTDITQMKVDAIVNAANDELKNNGGVALAISKSAGHRLKKECDHWIATNGVLPIGHVAVTNGYDLPAKHVIHVVGPKWSRSRSDHCKQMLYMSFKNCLDQAAILKISSIAVPAVSAGIYGGPIDVVAELMCEAVVDFCAMKTTVTDIYLVDISDEIPTYVASILTYSPDVTVESGNSGSQGAQYTTPPAGQQGGASPITRQENSREATHKGQSGNKRQVATVDGSGEMTNVKQATGSTNGGFRHNSLMQHGSDERKQDAGETYISLTGQGEECAICMESKAKQVSMRCGHVFCQSCIDTWLKNKHTCPTCGQIFGALRGNQPKGKGNCNKMSSVIINQRLPGFEKHKTIQITYSFSDGTQQEGHPHPGVPYRGTNRTAYLPDSPEGIECLRLLREAFDARLLFTIGRSVTTGKDDQVTWNDIHHKTSIDGGPTRYGYPDPTYLSRLREELASKGIK